MSRYRELTKLADILRRSDETVGIKPDVVYREVTVKMWGKGVVLRGPVTGAEIASSRRFVARAGQFILSRIDARNGALGVVPAELDGAVVTNDFPLFAPNPERLDVSYLGWLSRGGNFVELCRRASEGTTNRVRLQEELFLSFGIKLPPLAEQRQIVARIENLAAQIDNARILRQLASDEAKALLMASRRTAILGSPAEVIALEDACAAIVDNLHSNPQLSETGVPCIRSPDVGYGTLDLDGAQRTDEAEYHRRTARGEPKENDIVLVREGGGTGKCAVVQPGQRFSLGQRVMMLRPDTDRIVPRFFLHQLLSPLVQEEQIAPLSKGSASPHLNISALRRFELRLPGLPEQRRIAADLDALETEVNALRRVQTETAIELDALLPSILNRAFNGGI